MKASEVIDKARYTLSDVAISRWSDIRLLSLLNDALLDIAANTRLYSYIGYIQLLKNIARYDLSDDAISIERAEHLSLPLKKVSFEEMDDVYGSNWQEDTSDTITHIVYNLTKGGEFRVYPVPLLGNTAAYTQSNSLYGVITAINYEYVKINVTGSYGDLKAPDIAHILKLYLIKKPTKITSVVNDLDDVIDRTMLSPLAHYVAGMALRDNIDVQDRVTGSEEVQLYTAKIQSLQDQKSAGNVKRVRTTEYRGMG